MTAPAAVGINLLWLVPGQVGGSEESTVATLHALRALAPPDLALQLFALEPFAAAHPDLVATFPTTLLSHAGGSRLARIAAESSWLATRTRGLDLVHHAGGTAPLRAGAPYVLTIHDLQPLERRATHGGVKRAYLSAVLPRAVKGARGIAVPSDFVRSSVLQRFGADPRRVVTIPHGVSAGRTEAATAEDVRARYRLSGPVVLYPAITYPHKDHATLVGAFALVRQHHPEAVLVLTGGEGACEREVADQIDRLGLRASVRRTGRIPTADVAGLYSVASVVAVPSTYEGFGLPAAEAMAAGVAVVAARDTAIPEVVGDAGVLVPPGDVTAWAAAIGALLDDGEERVRLAGLGRLRVEQFTWEANAEGFAALYRRAVAGA